MNDCNLLATLPFDRVESKPKAAHTARATLDQLMPPHLSPSSAVAHMSQTLSSLPSPPPTPTKSTPDENDQIK